MLAQFQTQIRELSLMQNSWATALNPLLAAPTANAIHLKDLKLITGDNVINTRLNKRLEGWIVTDINQPATVYRSQPIEPNNITTITLNASQPVTISLMVY